MYTELTCTHDPFSTFGNPSAKLNEKHVLRVGITNPRKSCISSFIVIQHVVLENE